jgi:hypothetical protein
MNILFVETAAHGHFVHLYLNLILLKIKSNPKINISLMVTREVYKNIDINIKKHVKNIFFFKEVSQPVNKNFLNLIFYQLKYYFNIKKNFLKYCNFNVPDLVYLNTFDHCDKALSVFGSPFHNVAFSGLFSTSKFHLYKYRIGPSYPLNFMYKYLFKKILKIKTLKNLFIIDPLLKMSVTTESEQKLEPVIIDENFSTANVDLGKQAESKGFNIGKMLNIANSLGVLPGGASKDGTSGGMPGMDPKLMGLFEKSKKIFY